MEFVVWIVLTITPPDFQVDVGGTLAILLKTDELYDFCGTAWVPHVVTYDPTCDSTDRSWRWDVLDEELLHQEQYQALGPAYPIVYGLTLGDGLEPYSNFPRDYHGLEAMWKPPESLTRQCPAFRITSEGVEVLPCWRF